MPRLLRNRTIKVMRPLMVDEITHIRRKEGAKDSAEVLNEIIFARFEEESKELKDINNNEVIAKGVFYTLVENASNVVLTPFKSEDIATYNSIEYQVIMVNNHKDTDGSLLYQEVFVK